MVLREQRLPGSTLSSTVALALWLLHLTTILLLTMVFLPTRSWLVCLAIRTMAVVMLR